MKRRDRDGRRSDLPEINLSALDPDETLFLRHMLGMIETGDMFHGRFVEVHVARVLGADLSDSGVNGWDLWLGDDPPITIEVKATAAGGGYTLRRPSKSTGKSKKARRPKADVWVFVTFADKTQRPRQFSFVVVPRTAVDVMPDRVSQAWLFAQHGPAVDEAALLARVREVAAAAERPESARFQPQPLSAPARRTRRIRRLSTAETMVRRGKSRTCTAHAALRFERAAARDTMWFDCCEGGSDDRAGGKDLIAGTRSVGGSPARYVGGTHRFLCAPRGGDVRPTPVPTQRIVSEVTRIKPVLVIGVVRKGLPRYSAGCWAVYHEARNTGNAVGVNSRAMEELLSRYLRDIGKVPRLTAAEERDLARAIEDGRDAATRIERGEKGAELKRLVRKATEARDHLIRANLRLVVSIASRYSAPDDVELMDLIQEGNIGLERAVDKFDWRRGRFSHYASYSIRKSIGRAIDHQTRLVQTCGGSGLAEPLQDDGGIELDAVWPLIDRELTDELLSTLDNRQRRAVEARFGLLDGERKSLREISDHLKVDKNDAHSMVIRALKALRRNAAQDC